MVRGIGKVTVGMVVGTVVALVGGAVALAAPAQADTALSTSSSLSASSLSASSAAGSTPSSTAGSTGSVGSLVAAAEQASAVGSAPAISAQASAAAEAANTAVTRYWTPQRLAAATPDPAPTGKAMAGTGQAATTQAPTGATPQASTDQANTDQTAGSGQSQQGRTTPAPIPNLTAAHFDGVPDVGTLAHTVDGSDHFCTASVVASPRLDLIITAAHCIYGATNVAFIPQYHLGVRPFGTWAVSQVFVDPRWAADRDTDADFAIAVVQPQDGLEIQQVVGANGLAIDMGYANRVTVIGYPDTSEDPVNQPVTCTNFTSAWPDVPNTVEFECHGYWDGTSGSPFLLYYDPRTGEGITNGVIGGYDAGGPNEYLSCTTYFGPAVASLYWTALTEQQQ